MDHFVVYMSPSGLDKMYSWHIDRDIPSNDLVLVTMPPRPDGVVHRNKVLRGFYVPTLEDATQKFDAGDGVVRTTYCPAEDFLRSKEELIAVASALQKNPRKGRMKRAYRVSASLPRLELGEPEHLATLKYAIAVVQGTKLPSFRKTAAVVLRRNHLGLPSLLRLLNQSTSKPSMWRVLSGDEVVALNLADAKTFNVDDTWYEASDCFAGLPPGWIAKRVAILKGGKAYISRSSLCKEGDPSCELDDRYLKDVIERILVATVHNTILIREVRRVRLMMRYMPQSVFDDPLDLKVAEMIYASTKKRQTLPMVSGTPTLTELWEAAPLCLRGPFSPGSTIPLKNGHRFMAGEAFAGMMRSLRLTDVEEFLKPIVADMNKNPLNKDQDKVGELTRQVKAALLKPDVKPAFPCNVRRGMQSAKSELVCPFKCGGQKLGDNVVACAWSRGETTVESTDTASIVSIWLGTGKLAEKPEAPRIKPSPRKKPRLESVGI